MKKLGHGCRNLTLTASNKVTAYLVSTGLELCLLEPVKGLQAFLMEEEDDCPDSTDLNIGISLEQGAPVELLFTLIGARDTLSETREMLNGSFQTYTFSSPLEGTFNLSNTPITFSKKLSITCSICSMLNTNYFVKDRY